MVAHVVQTMEGGDGCQALAHLPGRLVIDAQIPASAVQQVMFQGSEAPKQANQQH